LQKLENQNAEGFIDLYYGDESHVCTGGYVPYGWQFKGEDYYVPCDQKFRLNCFGIIDRDSNYDGFTTTFFPYTLHISTLPKRFGEYSRESG
jgi:hypothetical protein